jgi:hypothetical protein
MRKQESYYSIIKRKNRENLKKHLICNRTIIYGILPSKYTALLIKLNQPEDITTDELLIQAIENDKNNF